MPSGPTRTEPKKNRPSHTPKHTTSGQGSAKQVPSSEKPAKKAPPLGAKKVTAKSKHGTKFQGPPPAAPAEAPGEVLHTNRPPLTGSKRVPRRKPRLLFTTRLSSLIESGVKSAPQSAAAAPPGQSPPEEVPPAERKTGKPGASSGSPA
jgi:hypothetical protein